MKRFLCFIISVIFCLSLSIQTVAASIVCDGIVNEYEWDGSTSVTIADNKTSSGCNLDVIFLRYHYDENDRRMKLAILASEDSEDVSDTPVGIYISAGGCSEISLYPDGTKDFNSDEYSVDGAFIQNGSVASAELDIILKDTFSSTVDIDIRLSDSFGTRSKLFTLTLKSDDLIKAESTTEKTTKNKTTKKKTTKKSSKKSSVKRTAKPKTTKLKTTAPKTVTVVEQHESYSEKVEKSNRAVIIIGVSCLALSMVGYFIIALKKND